LLEKFFNNHPYLPHIGHLTALIAGLLLPLSLAPFDWWPLGILSVLIFLESISGGSPGRILIRFYLYSLGTFALGVSWIYVSINVYGGAPPILAGFLVILFILAWSLNGLLLGFVYIKWARYFPRGHLFAFPVLWVLSEWFRGWFLTGFPWIYIGYGHLSSPLAGFAPVAGVLGISFVVVLSAVLIHQFLEQRKPVLILGVLVIWLSGFGLSQVDFVEEKGQVTVAAVQGNIDQHSKWQRKMVMPILNKYTDLTSGHWGADIIVWPEASITLFRENAGNFLQGLDEKGKRSGSTVVLGIPDRDEDGSFLNSAIVVGKGQGNYIKRHLVPFGEYVPFENWLRGLITFFDLPMSHNKPGPDQQEAPLADGLKLSLSICYEVVYSELVRSTTESPDLFITISNDTWFGSSIGPAQHLQMAQMRALENGRSMIRATNNGITATINHRGEITDSLPQFEPGVLRTTVSIMEGTTPYHRFGQLPILVLSIACLGLLVVVKRD
jgi:apolipoprotein N-acyltransferase